ncbi:MAG TPA: hypothetical protein V6D20_02255, partial [Candidatus Obscuribacterales bacterium]
MDGSDADITAALADVVYYSGGRCGEDLIRVEMNTNSPVNVSDVRINIRCVASPPNITAPFHSGPEDERLRLDMLELEATQPKEILEMQVTNLDSRFRVFPAAFDEATDSWDVQLEFQNALGNKKRAVPPFGSVADANTLHEPERFPYWQQYLLRDVFIIPPAHFNGNITFTIIGFSTDPENPNRANTTVNMTVEFFPVNDPAVITSPLSLDCLEDEVCYANDPLPISFSDIDLAGTAGPEQYSVALYPAPYQTYPATNKWFAFAPFFTLRGDLGFESPPVPGVNCTTYVDTGDGFNVSGTIDELNAILAQVRYVPETHGHGTAGYNIEINDNGNIGRVFNPLISEQIIKFEVKNVNDEPEFLSLPATLNEPALPCIFDPIYGCPVLFEIDEDSFYSINGGWSLYDLD